MAVWTQVSLSEVNDWLAARGLGVAASLSPVEAGMEDSLYHLVMKDGNPFCLCLFERTDPQGALTLTTLMASFGLPTCPPVKDEKGAMSLLLKGKQTALFPWIDGHIEPQPSLFQIEEMGSFLGKMARIGLTKTREWHNENPHGWTWLDSCVKEILPVLDSGKGKEIEKEIMIQKAFWERQKKRDIPRGPVHAALFKDNVFFDENDNLASVIDWVFCASDMPLVLDLAVAANDWCLQESSSELDGNRVAMLFMGYTQVRNLTEDEQKAWPMALRLAALSYYIFYLYDEIFPRQGGQGRPSEPFLQILRARQNMRA